MTSLRNNFYYVLLVVPLQTVFALFLATVLNNQLLKAKGFFRTAFYFPSVTSSVAISIIFLFLFSGGGAVNSVLAVVGVDGPTWFNDARGLLHLLGDGLGLWDAGAPPASLHGDVDPRAVGVAVAVRPDRGDRGHHHAGGLDHHRDVHAHVPGRAARRARRGAGGRPHGRRRPVAELPCGDAPAPAAHAAAGDHARPDRDLAGVRPGVRDDPGRAEQDHPDTGLPVVLLRLREPAVGRGRGHGVPALPHHLRPDLRPAVRVPGQGRGRDASPDQAGREAAKTGARAGPTASRRGPQSCRPSRARPEDRDEHRHHHAHHRRGHQPPTASPRTQQPDAPGDLPGLCGPAAVLRHVPVPLLHPGGDESQESPPLPPGTRCHSSPTPSRPRPSSGSRRRGSRCGSPTR